METKRNKRLIFWLLLVIGVMGILNTMTLSFYTNINIGTLIPGAVGVLMILYGFLRYIVRKGLPVIPNRVIRRIISTAVVLAVASFAIIEGLIIINSNSDGNTETDYLVILGAGLRGEMVSLTLKERLEKGIDYLIKYPDTQVIVSGGQGRGESITEAEAMRRYLIRKGISEERIIKEDRATSTMENLKFSKEILKGRNNGDTEKITIVTSDFHMLRAKMLAKRNGFDPRGITCDTPVQVRLNSYMREYFAIIKSLLLDR